jgi:hypothetical protein
MFFRYVRAFQSHRLTVSSFLIPGNPDAQLNTLLVYCRNKNIFFSVPRGGSHRTTVVMLLESPSSRESEYRVYHKSTQQYDSNSGTYANTATIPADVLPPSECLVSAVGVTVLVMKVDVGDSCIGTGGSGVTPAFVLDAGILVLDNANDN